MERAKLKSIFHLPSRRRTLPLNRHHRDGSLISLMELGSCNSFGKKRRKLCAKLRKVGVITVDREKGRKIRVNVHPFFSVHLALCTKVTSSLVSAILSFHSTQFFPSSFFSSLPPPPPSHAPNIPIRIFLPSSILSPPPLWHARMGATVAAQHPRNETTQPVMETNGALAPHAIDGGGDQK